MKQIEVQIVDDHDLFIGGIMAMLEDVSELTVTSTATNGTEAREMLEKSCPDVLLLDINLPDVSGLELCKEFRAAYPSLGILAVTMHSESSFIQRMLKQGASGYVLKNIDKEELVTAIKDVSKGGTYFSKDVTASMMNSMMAGNKKATSKGNLPALSRREKEVLKLIMDEHTTQEIAEALFISVPTVESHRHNLLTKLGARNSAGLVKVALENGLLD